MMDLSSDEAISGSDSHVALEMTDSDFRLGGF